MSNKPTNNGSGRCISIWRPVDGWEVAIRELPVHERILNDDKPVARDSPARCR